MIDSVAVVGGTHGNEYTGPAVLHRLGRQHPDQCYTTFTTTLLLANPRAFREGRRYIDHDLNRSFLAADLGNQELKGYEFKRAREINAQLGPREDPVTDLLIDVHTSTANMGTTMIVVGYDQPKLQIAAFLQKRLPAVRIYAIPAAVYGAMEDQPFLTSMARCGISLELGPIGNNIVRHDLLARALQGVRCCLDFVELRNLKKPLDLPETVTIHEHVRSVSYPVDPAGSIDAVVHQALQDRDYHPLKAGAPLFYHPSGEVTRYHEKEPLVPIFINEAAYYGAKTAFVLTRRRTLSVPLH